MSKDNVAELKKRIKSLQKQLKEMEAKMERVEAEKLEYMHEMLDLVKRREINVHHTKRKIRTVSHLTGYERTVQLQKEEAERKQKKRKTRN